MVYCYLVYGIGECIICLCNRELMGTDRSKARVRNNHSWLKMIIGYRANEPVFRDNELDHRLWFIIHDYR